MFRLSLIFPLLLLSFNYAVLAQDADEDMDSDDESALFEGEPDSSAARNVDALIGLNEHIGQNGITLGLGLVLQQWGRYTHHPHAVTVSGGLTGDILTGVPFIHLMPSAAYWTYSEAIQFGPFIKMTYRDAGLAFNVAFITPRLKHPRIRVFAGGGPSLHLTVVSRYDPEGKSEMTPGFKNGIGVMGGAEWPINQFLALVVTGSYRRTYEWDRLYRTFAMLSLGLGL